ncbi:MAG TPA: hypothetical protein VFF54_01720 [Thermodesulfobacteriota bacterium]|nr:hypothetical protein [Thermodesulfobacteriota bacterium]
MKNIEQWRPFMAKDPVCGMEVSEKDASFMTRLEHETSYFCSKACQEKFETSMGIASGESGKKWWQKILKEPKEKPPKCH